MKLKEKFKMTLPKLVSIMKKSENYGGILTMFAVVLVVAFWAIDVFGEDQPILAILALIAFLVYVVAYIVIFTVPNVYTVYKYRKEPWPQKHKFLWVLVGLGYAQVTPAWFVLPFRNNDMVARITVVISIIVLIVANSAVKMVEKEKTRTKEQGKGLE